MKSLFKVKPEAPKQAPKSEGPLAGMTDEELIEALQQIQYGDDQDPGDVIDWGYPFTQDDDEPSGD